MFMLEGTNYPGILKHKACDLSAAFLVKTLVCFAIRPGHASADHDENQSVLPKQ
jgi:hypothetical protein